MNRLILTTWLILSAASVRADLTLSSKGKTDYRIVVATNTIPSERYAAEELQSYLEKITGAKFPIVGEDAKPAKREILVGASNRMRQLGTAIDFAQLGPEGFVLRTDGRRLVIAGGKPRGTLYGVYTFLEEKLGVRWFTQDLEQVPRTNRLSIAVLNQTTVPRLEYREVFWTEMMRDPNFAARHRLNGHHYALTEKHGGRPAVYFPFVHSFDSLVPPEMFKEHPEYFPWIDGQRVGGYVQRCLSNPEVLKISIERVRQWIKGNPDVTIVSVSQNDVGKWCRCETCKALDEAEGSPAASVIRFVNAIAENIEKDFPAVRIDTLAYQYSRKPPRTLRPRHNVIIRLCSIECCFAHPLETCPSEENRRFRDDIIAWQPVAPLLYVWDYTPNFAHYQQPFPNFDALQPNVKFFTSHGVKGLFEQGNYSGGGAGEMGPLRSYILAKLLWNPDTDPQRHMTEFLAAYYGGAAPHIRSYLELLEDQVRENKSHAHIVDSSNARYLNAEFLAGANRIFDTAESASDNDTIRFRVQTARLPVWYVELATNRVKDQARTDLLEKFLAIARKAGVSNISEGKSLKDWATSMGVK